MNGNDSLGKSKKPPSIAVLEDDEAVRRLLERVLDSSNNDVRFAHDGAHLLSLVELGLVQLVLLDLMLPGESGMDVGRRLRARSDVPIVILSALGQAECIAEGLDAFADDYVTKPFSPSVLRSRIGSVLRRCAQRPFAQGAAGMFDVEIDECRLEYEAREFVTPGRPRVALTEREYQIFVCLCRSAFRVVTRDALSQILNGRDWDPTDRSLDVHICNLRVKLKRALTGHPPIKAVRGKGYLLECSPRFLSREASRGAPPAEATPAK